MTRLVQIGKYFPPAAGGIEAVTAAVRTQLAPFAEVTTLVANHDDGELIETPPPFDSGQLVVRSRSLGRLFSMPICPSLPAQLLRHTGPGAKGSRADLVMLHHPNPMACAAYVLARPKCPLVVFYHSDIVRQRALGAAAGWLLAAVGVTSCLYAVYDLADLLPWGGARETDAVLLARSTGVPAFVWAVVWACVSLFLLLWFGRLAARRRG